MQTFTAFYKECGVRTATVFRSPIPRPVKHLCRGAVLHIPAEEGKDFPDDSLVFLNKLPNRIYLYNELKLIDDNKSVGVKHIQKEVLARSWVTNHKKQFQISLKPIGAITDENQLVTINYGLADAGYRYSESVQLTPFNKWLDYQKTLWARVSEVAKTTSRQNFVIMGSGTELPSLSALRTASKAFTVQSLAFFDDDVKKNILDIWKFLDPETRSTSCLGVLDVTSFSRINLLFQMFDGTTVVLNLGYLNSWVKGQPNQTENSSVSQKDPASLQIDFIRFLIVLQNYNIEGQRAAREAEEAKEGDRQSLSKNTGKKSDTAGQDVPEVPDDVEGEEDGQITERPPSQTGTNSTEVKRGVPVPGVTDPKGKEPDAVSVDTSNETEVTEADEIALLEDMETRRVNARGVLKQDIAYDPEESTPLEVLEKKVSTPPVFGENVLKRLDTLVDKGAVSAAEYRKIVKSLEAFKSLPNPFTGTGNILEAATVKPQDVVFDVKSTSLVDPTGLSSASVQNSCVEELDRGYVRNVFRKEILASLISVVDLGTLIENLEIQERETAEGRVMEISMTMKPIGGKPSQIRHKIPVPEEDGTFKAKGVRYHSRKQINDINYRKIHGDEVSLGTYTSKLFVNRSRAKAHNSTEYIAKNIVAGQLSGSDKITKIRTADVYERNFKAPFIYSTLSEFYKSFDVENVMFGKLTLDFEQRTRGELLGEDVVTQIEKNGNVLCGKTEKGLPVFVGPDEVFYVRTKNGDEPLGNIYSVLDIDESKAPPDFAEMSLLGKTVPVGIVLGRQLGFRNLLKLSKVNYRMEEGRSVRVEPHEFRVRFKDKTFVFDKRDKLSCLIFSGYTKMENSIKNYPAVSFDQYEVYDAILESQDLNQMHLREIDNLSNGFVDPISLRRIKAQGGPQTFTGMLLQSCKDLTNNYSPDTQDTDSQQILGYERFAAAIHREVYKANRKFRNQNATGRAKINMSHYAVWQSIMEDGTIKTCEDINPIQNLKMHEALTFAGEGGRSRETFNLPARAFNKKAAGIHSEASVDSGDVAYNLFLSWNPTLGDLNGIRKPTEKLGFGNLLSTSLNLVVGPNHNDMKRNCFTSIQNTHTISCDGYEQPRVQTGNEALISQRVDSLFCKVAKDDGRVVAVTNTGVIVEYKDKTREGVEIGRRYGDAEGTTYPHDLVTTLKVGDKVLKGETIAYNTGFFEPSTINPRFCVLKFGVYTNVAYIEVPETHEDSCSIGPQLVKDLGTKVTDPRSYELRFTQNVHDVIKPGTEVTPDTVLMVIEDEITSGTGVFDAQSTTTLGRLSRNAPRAGHTGILDRIECHYHGDKADLSPSLRKLVDASDRQRAEISRSAEKATITGKVSSDWSLKGKPLQLDSLEVTFFITANKSMGNADKLVFGEQLKSTVGKVELRKITTESGREVGAVFGGSSVIKRIVLTVVNIGSTIAIMDHCVKASTAAYFGR